MPCSNPFDQHLKDAAKRDEDLLKRKLPTDEPRADQAFIDKMKRELERLRQQKQ